ncbi:hypothetical protein TMS3_0107770 [Pseudomonas taeanensis MS-3]|uniref:Uncharacterized protein n=1 Tax=Pseudomonas taeanensis MS-3 TaxID=1395571 RepID=A0A0A1YR81_9PSED|nr:hypothetical protein [Pseudomonas taeanensis]KFX71798.1 hypothetical protein TMS3_0107770 [Pseudomonas taeanensis MS-3]
MFVWFSVKGGVGALLLALLIGCSSSPKVTLPEPKDVPREKWSDAMLVLEAMRIDGQRDIPREMVGSEADSLAPQLASVGVGDLTIGGLGYVSPPTGFSSAGAASLGLGLFLFGGSGGPVYHYQVVAWVPEELATTPENASLLVKSAWLEAREKYFNGKISNLRHEPAQYADGSGKKFDKFTDLVKGNPTPFSAPASGAPPFISAKKAYGPIFLTDPSLELFADANRAGMDGQDALAGITKYLPGWVYSYYPGKNWPKDFRPAAIYNKNGNLYFIGR